MITGVTLSLRRDAEARALSVFAAPSTAAGLEFQRQVIQSGWAPPVMRQYDERESGRLHADARDCTVLMVHEGPAGLVAAEKAAVDSLSAAAGLASLPSSVAEHWLEHRNHVVAWDTILSRNIVADTVEISATWDRIGGIYEAAVAGLKAIEGCLAASAHSSHVYRSGVNLYFTFAIGLPEPERMEAAYFAAWDAIMTATAEGGGGVAHHHGIGRVRRDWLQADLGPEGVALLRRLKAAIDPAGVMNPGVLIPDA